MADRYDNDTSMIVDAVTDTQGDTSFVGLDNRRSPDELDPGFLQQAQNVRLNQGVASIRKGMAKQTNSISFTTVPLIIPFIVGSGAIISDNSNDGIFGVCLFSDPNNANLEWVFMACGSKAYIFAPGQSVVSMNYPANETIVSTDTVDVFQAGGNVYILRGETDLTVPVTSITSSSTTATVTTTSAHGYITGQWIRMAGANQANYNGDFQITVSSGTVFTYTMAGTATSPATGTFVLNRLKVPLKWNGNQSSALTAINHGFISSPKIYMPPSNFGTLQANRSIVEYSRNAVVISDINNVESYDSIFALITVSPGWSDFLVGAHPYQNNQALLFNRRSIYLLNNVSGDAVAITNQLLTQQVGCVSRRSIATCGPDVLFLSDMGVFRLQPGLELNLRGNSEPLSAPIDPTIRTINFSQINTACAAYWNNRYFLAVPVNGSTRNNMLLVYNFINGQWESIDTFPNGFNCDFLSVRNLNNAATLFVISREGGIYAYEQNEQDDFAAAQSAPTQYLINGIIRTRRFTFGTFNIKRFNRCIVNMSLDDNSAFDTTAFTINPDGSKLLSSTSVTTANDITRPLLIGKRGYGIDIQFANTANRGSINSFSISAHITGFKSIENK